MFYRLWDLIRTYDRPHYLLREICWRFPKNQSDLDAVFVVGAPRSGTTLLQRMLAVHPSFFSIQGETGIFSWQSVFRRESNPFGLDVTTHSDILEGSKDIVDYFSRSVRFLSGKAHGARFVEKTPQHVLWLPFILKYFPNAQVIHIVRDGRDCFCSARNHPNIPQRSSASSFASYWKRCVRAAMQHESPNRLITISYEDLVSETESTLQSLMSTLGESFVQIQTEPNYLSQDLRSRRPEFNRLLSVPDGSTIGRWKDEMSSREISSFHRIAGQMLSHYGY